MQHALKTSRWLSFSFAMLRCWHQGSVPVLRGLQEVGESCDVVQQQTDKLCPAAVQMSQQDDDRVKKENSHLTACLGDICSSCMHVNTPLYYTQTAYCRSLHDSKADLTAGESACGLFLETDNLNQTRFQQKTVVLSFSLLSVRIDWGQKGTGLSFCHPKVLRNSIRFDHMTPSQDKWLYWDWKDVIC